MTIRRRIALAVIVVGACWIVGAVIQFYEFVKYFGATGREPIPLVDTMLTKLAFTLSPLLWLMFGVGGDGIWSGSGGSAMIPRVVVQTAVQAVVVYGMLARFRRTPRSRSESN